MKIRIISLVLALLMIAALVSACGSGTKKNEANTANNTDANASAGETVAKDKVEDTGSTKFIFGYCRFTDTIKAEDSEFINSGKTAADNKIYVDLLLEITDAGENGLSQSDVKGSVTYEGNEYNANYFKNYLTEAGIVNDPIDPHGYGRIHLFSSLPAEAAEQKDLEFKYSIDGKDFTAKVGPAVTVDDPLSVKTELKIGDDISPKNGEFTVEVFRCTDGALTTSDPEKSEQYVGEFVDLVLKITNNTDSAMSFSYLAYTFDTDGEAIRMNDRIESMGHTSLETTDKISSFGEPQYFHILSNTKYSADGIIRFNYDGNCYYIKAEKTGD